MPDKTTTQPVQTAPTMKHHLITASISAGIVLVVIFLFWFTFKVIPSVFSGGANFVATSLSSTFVPADNTTKTNTPATTNTNPSTTQTAPATTASNYQPTYYTAPAVALYGQPDLAISLIATGIIDPGSKQFYPTSYAGANDTIAIKFEVKNIGTNVSGPWDLRLNMPSRTTPYYDSGEQISIKPGDRIDYVASFDSPVTQGINTAYITADPLNLIAESNEANNELTVPLNIQGTTYNYNNNYNYGTVSYGAPLPYGSLYTWTNINANCYANPQATYPGSQVTWFATASGGNGYYTYSWAGTDGISGTASSLNTTYYSVGTKIASITVTSNGQSITKACSVNVL
jgi:hypothetical protein